MTLQDILRAKGNAVHTISPGATLEDVVQKLVKHNCGSLVVAEPDGSPYGRLLGIITERDILRTCARHQGALTEIEVAVAMTIDVITASPTDSVEDTMGLMTENRIRHLPMMESGHLIGIISIGDVVKAQHNTLTMENHYLKSYIHGEEPAVGS